MAIVLAAYSYSSIIDSNEDGLFDIPSSIGVGSAHTLYWMWNTAELVNGEYLVRST